MCYRVSVNGYFVSRYEKCLVLYYCNVDVLAMVEQMRLISLGHFYVIFAGLHFALLTRVMSECAHLMPVVWKTMPLSAMHSCATRKKL